MKLLPAISTAFLAAGLLFSLNAQSVTTDPVGYVTFDLNNNSDSFFSVPLQKSPSFSGLASFSSSDSDSVTLTVSSATWSVDQFSDYFFIRFLEGDLAGYDFTVLSNSSNSITVESRGLDFSLVETAPFDLIQHWTLDTLFPPETQTAIVPSLGNLGFQRRTTVFIPDIDGVGINRSSAQSHYINNNVWVRTVSGNPPSGNTIIHPGVPIIIRHPSTVIDPTQLVVAGQVSMNPITAPVLQLSSVSQDNILSNPFPVNVSLRELGLFESGAFSASAGTLGFQRTDTLFVFDITGDGSNRSASASFIYTGGEWRKRVTGDPVVSDDRIIEPGQVMIVRKSTGSIDQDIPWQKSLQQVISNR